MSNKNGTNNNTSDGETTDDELMDDDKNNLTNNKDNNTDNNSNDNSNDNKNKIRRKKRKKNISSIKNRRSLKRPRKRKITKKNKNKNKDKDKRKKYTNSDESSSDDENDPFLNGFLGNMPIIRPLNPERPPLDNIPRFKIILKDGKIILKKMGDDENSDDSEDKVDKNEENKVDNPFDREGDFDVIIRREIKGIDDLIELGQMYDPNCNKKYNFDVMRLHSLIEPLTELKTLVGMEKVKQNIVNQIVFYLLKLDKKNQNMMHTVIEGSPGVGKTTLGKILAKIYLKMGVVTRDYFKVVKRSDLIAEYVGQTAPKTQKVIDEAKGGVLFIDEAYSLGNPEKKDIFSKECLDTININLSEMKDNFVMIIAGYKDSLKSSFFAYNDGLMRRFPFRYSIDDYKGDELHKIFLKVVNENEWEVLPKAIPKDFFNDNKHYFKFNGGDIESFFQTCKIAHARRVFCCPINERRKLTRRDITRGLELFLLNPEVKERKEEKDTLQYMFYT